MKIAIVQLRVRSNQINKNLDAIKKYIDQHRHEADLIVFPEMALGGYLLGDKYFNSDMVEELITLNETIKAYSHDTAVIWGNIYQDAAGKLYNAAYFASNGSWVNRESKTDAGYYLKHLLPTYSFFDDARYFESGHGNFEPFEFKGQKIAIQICEDLWHDAYDLNPTKLQMAYKPDVLINISASPWTMDKEVRRHDQVRKHQLDIPYVYVNATGMQNNGKNVVLFDGGSFASYQESTMQLHNNFEENSELIDLDKITNRKEQVTAKPYQALLHAIRYFDEETLPFGPKWIVGVSGGLDSSVTVALLAQALGKERVIGVTMPSNFTRDITKNNAYHLAEKLGIQFMEIPIGDMVDATVSSLNKANYEKVEGLSYENIQARLRGHTLMSISALENGVVCNNGNKIEVALGYATLYGDAIGALAVLGDLTKMEVGMIAREINNHAKEEIVPVNLIPVDDASKVSWDFAPSAELAQDQFDPMKWGYHDALIQYLMTESLEDLLLQYQDGSIYETKLGKYLKAYGLDDACAFSDDLKWVINTMNRAVYKRIQMPPIVSLTETAFGLAYRETQMPVHFTEKQQRLLEELVH